MATKPQIGVQHGRYYEATKEGRGRNSAIVVKVWNGDKKEGEPTHEWEMPGILGMDAAIAQAIVQSR